MNYSIKNKISKILENIDSSDLDFRNNSFVLKASSKNLDESLLKLNNIGLEYEEDIDENIVLKFQSYFGDLKIFYYSTILQIFDEAFLMNDFIVFDNNLNWIFFDSERKLFETNNSQNIEFYNFSSNIYYYYLLFDNLKSKKFCDHFDDAHNQIVIYSEKKGIFKIVYNNKPTILNSEIYKENILNLIEIIKNLELKMFLKNNLFSITNNSLKIDISDLIEKSEDLYENSIRDYELYSKKFEFDKFKDNLYKEKEKFFISIREIINKIYSQAVSIPVLISASTLASYKLPNEYFINTLILLILIAYSIFYNKILIYYLKDLKVLKKEFKRDFNIIETKSGLDKKIISNEKKNIRNKINSSLSFIKTYLIFIDIIIVLAFFYILYNGFNLKL